jgi:hypothetical protein
MKKTTLDERIQRAREAMSQWTPQKQSMVRLQGTEPQRQRPQPTGECHQKKLERV